MIWFLNRATLETTAVTSVVVTLARSCLVSLTVPLPVTVVLTQVQSNDCWVVDFEPAVPVEVDEEPEAARLERQRVRAGAGGGDADPLDGLAAQLPERVRHRGRAVRRLDARGQLTVEPQQRLLSTRSVERTSAAGLERERHDALELGCVVLFDLSTGERRTDRVQARAGLARRHSRQHGIDLGERELELLAANRDARHACASSPRIACSSCSKPPVSIAQCMPHSFGAFVSHHQRPARAGSPGAIARVQGAQPIDV